MAIEEGVLFPVFGVAPVGEHHLLQVLHVDFILLEDESQFSLQVFQAIDLEDFFPDA